MNKERILACLLVLVGLIAFKTDQISAQGSNSNSDAIQPYHENSWYWQYKGEPILLIGGSNNDNLFQWTGDHLTNHLDSLKSVGGNYVRNTMSDRDEGSVYAPKEIEDGLYDLTQWNDEYWNRLEFFLSETEKREIIVQLTLWDWFDLSGLSDHPYNPENNVNFTAGLIEDREDFYGGSLHEDKKSVLEYQHRFVDKLLSFALDYEHVLYNVNNESAHGKTWENHWARYIHQTAEKMNRKAYVTIMKFDPSNSVRTAMSYRDIYNFIEISQNNQDSRGGRGQGHWDNIINWRKKIASHAGGPMPMNNVKVYGAKDGVNYSAGSETEAINRFWRNIFAGCASSRFHRPAEPSAWGSGLNKRVQTNLKAMTKLLENMDIFSASPHNDLLWYRVAAAPGSMEAYVTAEIGSQYAVYFPPGRFTVDLDPWIYVDELKVRWLDINSLKWSDTVIVKVPWEGDRNDWGSYGRIRLKTPGNRPCD